MEPHRSSSAVLSELRLGVGRAGICAPNAMPGIDLAFLEFLVLWVSVLVMVSRHISERVESMSSNILLKPV